MLSPSKSPVKAFNGIFISSSAGYFTNCTCRKKEDPWNAIIAGFFTGTFVQLLPLNTPDSLIPLDPRHVSHRHQTCTDTFFLLPGGSLAIRGGARAVRNGAIGCAILLAVIEGVGIGFQRMMAENTRLDIPPPPPSQQQQSGPGPTSAAVAAAGGFQGGGAVAVA